MKGGAVAASDLWSGGRDRSTREPALCPARSAGLPKLLIAPGDRRQPDNAGVMDTYSRL